MPGWTLVDAHPTHGRTFRRPLDPLELCFLWDGLFDGTQDSLHHYQVRLSNGSRDAHLFSEMNIVKAWVSTKRRFPLVGAVVCGADGAPLQPQIATASHGDTGTGFASEPHFIVRERDLDILRLREVVFGSVPSAEEAQRQAAAIIHGPRLLSEDLLVRLYIFRETDTRRTDVLHLMLLMAHCVTDGTANRTLVRCLLDTLARGAGGDSELGQSSLEERLATVVPPMDLEPASLRALGPGVRRWRKAVGMVIHRLRTTKIQGGHTLPCRHTRQTAYTSARPGHFSAFLSHDETTAVISHCRRHCITFGNAYLALAQVAMTRVLYRRYLRGEISEEEWAYRRRQPHINGGPLNLRPYLDKPWFENGGGGEFMLCISLFMHQLPFMTLGAQRPSLSVLSDGAPPFSELLTFDRFLHRARLVKTQAKAFFGHPLFLEIVQASHRAYLPYTRFRALHWIQRLETADGRDTCRDPDKDQVPPVTDMPSIWAHGGSSLGNLDLISPTEYPLPSTHPLSPYCRVPCPTKAGYVSPPTIPSNTQVAADVEPKITVENNKVHLHVCPAELYLGAATFRGRMNMYVHYDANVFEDEVVREWLDEIKGAMLWYLGRSSQ